MSRLRRSPLLIVLMAFVFGAPVPAGGSDPPPGGGPSFAAEAVNPVVLVGSGFGHGVGMSQYGAYAMAKAGSSSSDIIGYYYQGATVGSVPGGLGQVGVGIVRSEPEVSLHVLGRAGGASRAQVHRGSESGPVVFECQVNDTCIIRATAGRVEVVGADPPALGDRNSPLVVTVDQPIGPVFVDIPQWGAITAHGHLVVLPTVSDGGRLNVVNFLDLDYAYVAGIAEVPSSWPAAALDAQAIAARTYAWQRHRGGACDCDVTADTFDQVYSGWTKERQQAWADAAARTRGLVAQYQGQKVQTFYSSSSGGRTESNEDAFGGTPVPYLRSIDDPWSLTEANPYRIWRQSYSADEAAANLGFDRVLGFSVSRRTQGGSIATAVVSGVRGGVGATQTFTGNQLRFNLDLPSTHADVPTSNFDEYLLLYNPNSVTTTVSLSFLLSGGDPPIPLSVLVGPGARRTIHVNDYAPSRDVSVAVHAGAPVVAERAMYFLYQGKWAGGHASEGVTAPATRWLLAEGYVAPNFDTYVLVANPGTVPTTAHLRLFGSDGRTTNVDLPLPRQSRGTVKLNDVAGFAGGDVSVEVTSDQPVVAERSQYFDYTGLDGRGHFSGGHNAPGVPNPATSWFLAEGYTAEAFDTFVLLENPGAADAHSKMTFLRPSGPPVVQNLTVPAHSRTTVVVNRVPGLEQTEVSTRIDSDVPIVAEHSMYFDYRGWVDGNDAEGVTAPQAAWFLAEGYAAPNFDTYVLVANFDLTRTANVTLEYHQQSGLAGTRRLDVPPGARRTVKVNDDVSGDVSTAVLSTNGVPIVAERSMYFDFGGRKGGSDAVGVAAPSPDWFFGEGYTGS